MERQGQGVRYWVLGSAALMIVGAFGTWVRVLGISVSGTDGSNDGWIVVAAAAIGGLLFYLSRATNGGGGWALTGGLIGAGVSLYDRSHLQHAINKSGLFAHAFIQVGWGLNLDLVASISMAVAALVFLSRHRQDARGTKPPFFVPPASPPSPPPSTPPSSTLTPPSTPTSPPD